MWEETQESIRRVLTELEIPFYEAEGEAAARLAAEEAARAVLQRLQ